MHNKGFKIIILTVMAALLAGCFAACNIFRLLNPVYSLEYALDEVTITIGESYKPELKVSPSKYSGKLKFESSDSEVVTVADDGTLTGVSDGAATVTVSCDTSEATDSITVKVGFNRLSVLLILADSALLSQIFSSGQTQAQEVVFTLSTNAGVDPAETEKTVWKIFKKSSNTLIKTGSGNEISYVPATLGETYVVTAEYTDEGEDIYLSDSKEFGWYNPLTGISLTASSAAVMGEEHIVNAAFTPSGADPNSRLQWYVASGGGSFIEAGVSAPPLKFIPEEYGVYSVYATFTDRNGQVITGSPVSFAADYAAVSKVEISAARREILITESIDLTVSWNKRYNHPDTVYTINWHIDGVLQSGTSDEVFNFSASSYGAYVITATVNGVASAAFEITVSDRWAALAEIKVTPDRTGILSGNTAITYTAALLPALGTNPNLNFDWYLDDVLQTGYTDNTFTFTPPSATKAVEYKVQAVIGNIKSAVSTAVVQESGPIRDVADFYLEDYHSYGGYTQNRFITSQEEMNNIVSYVRETRLLTISLYIDYDSSIPIVAGSGITSKVGKTFKAYMESGVSPTISGSAQNIGEAILNFNYTNASAASPTTTTAAAGVVQSSYVVPYSSATGRPSDTQLYIEKQTDTMLANNSNLLYKVVAWGYKPTFDSTSGSLAAYSAYSQARAVLLNIIDDNMDEVQKVQAIYDWICVNVLYDYALADRENDSSSMNYNGYYLEGVFTDSKAVCDGRSKAFTLMCGMEGIKSVRVVGTAGTGAQSTWGGHAWNKVLIDADKNGVKEWYVIDTTWGDTSMVEGGTVTQEILNRRFLLVSDSEISGTHLEDVERGNIPAAPENGFDYYKAASFVYGGTVYDFYITSTAELDVAIYYAESKGWSGIELKLSSSAWANNYPNKRQLSDNVYIIIIV